MRRKQTMWMMIAATTVLTGLTACSSDDGTQGADATGQGVEIRLASSVGDGEDYATRSNTATNLQSGDTCYVWADMVNPSTTPATVTKYFDAWALKANGAGGLTTLAMNNAKLFPATNALNFYAIVGNFGTKTIGEQQVPMITDGETEFPATGIAHMVFADQSTATNYYKSDLLYAVKKNQEPISEAVVLPFKHLLSRIQVVLVAGNGLQTTDLNEATVKLLNMKRKVTFTPDTTKDFSNNAHLAAMLSFPEIPSQGDITLATQVVGSVSDATAPGSTVYADAIVVPQSVAANAQLIEVNYLDRTTYYTVPTGGLTFESGKQYRFRLIADRIGSSYAIVPTVDDWVTPDRKNMWVE